MNRVLNVILALVSLIVLIIPYALIAILIKTTSRGPVLHWSIRVGKNNETFKMPKFRTMILGTPQVATDLLIDAHKFITPIGAILRRTSLDELPQVWSIIKGDMAFVGPRPALFNQIDLIRLRSVAKLDKLTPGLTGWAQVNGRDEIDLNSKLRLEIEYLNKKSLLFDIRILWITFLKVIYRAGISH
jgi:O-antigen biosynthesis protein WbqP